MAPLSSALLRAVADNGGATISRTGDVPTRGYVVALPDSVELRVPLVDGLETIVEAWLALPAVQQLDGYVGVWRDDDGRVCLDIVEVIADRATAVAAGVARGEDAVFCLHTGETISTAVAS